MLLLQQLFWHQQWQVLLRIRHVTCLLLHLIWLLQNTGRPQPRVLRFLRQIPPWAMQANQQARRFLAQAMKTN
jgi:hypothetical protein